MSQSDNSKPSTLDDDRRVLAILVEAGADLSKARRVWHYLYFGGSQSASEAAEVLRRDGVMVEVEPEPEMDTWLVKAEHEIVVNLETIDAWGHQLHQLATSLGGEYDGWEANTKP